MADFLETTLTPFAHQMFWQGHGIVEWAPAGVHSNGLNGGEIFVISAGIHGNETAPH